MALQRKIRRGAIAAAMGAATALGLKVDDAIVLHDSNKLTVRLLPCDTLARVADERDRRWAEFEIGLAQRLADIDSPVAALEPRVEPGIGTGSVCTKLNQCRIFKSPSPPR
jgi:hypothetical protein